MTPGEQQPEAFYNDVLDILPDLKAISDNEKLQALRDFSQIRWPTGNNPSAELQSNLSYSLSREVSKA
jgi:hypothetical protein